MQKIKPKRKLGRAICDSYIHIPKPATITQQHWDIWLKYNSGLTSVECAMVFGIKVPEITSIISGIVERLKNKSKLAEDWSEDFATIEAAMDFKQRIANNIYMAIQKAKKQGTNQILIMSEL
jgi:hypothetical protein